MINDNLKLVYVLNIGKNSKGEGLYEFIFSKDIDSLLTMTEDWGWDQSPANENVEPPTQEYCDKVFGLKTKKFDLFCLHDSYDRCYMDGVYTIHCIAHEKDDDDIDNNILDYENLFHEEVDDESPLLVFHFGMPLKQVEDILLSKDILFEERKSKKLAKS